MKVSELTGALLDCWVARAERYEIKAGFQPEPERLAYAPASHACTWQWLDSFQPSSSWEQGGPLLDKYQVCIGRGQSAEYPVHRDLDDNPIPGARIERKYATARVIDTEAKYQGDTTLIAGMRAIVASVYGPNVPDHPPQEA